MKIFTIIQYTQYNKSSCSHQVVSGRSAGDIAILSSRGNSLNPGLDLGSDPGEDIRVAFATVHTDSSVSKICCKT